MSSVPKLLNKKSNYRIIGLLMFCILAITGCSVKPLPITSEEHLTRIKEDRTLLYADQEELTAPLTLSMAIARALKYNLDNRMAMLESVLQDRQTALATLEMLPKLTANAGYTRRDNMLGSFSVPVFDSGDQPGYFTTSQDRERHFADLTLSWNILDLGISYYQAKQQANRLLIASEKQRRVTSNIIRQVCDAFHRASIAERLIPRVENALSQSKHALAQNYTVEQERLKPIIQVLQYRKDLLTIVQKLSLLQHNLTIAKAGLAALINLPSGQKYQILTTGASVVPPEIKPDIAQLEELGLYYRSDIREKVYTKRIDHYEKIKQTIQLFPGLTLTGSTNYDSNSFLMNNNWAETGVQTSLKLFDLVKGPQRLKIADTRLMLNETSRLALSVAVLVQINIAHEKYSQTLATYEISSDLAKVEQRLQKAVSDAASLKAKSELDTIRQNATTIASIMNRDMAYTNSLTALLELYTSIGVDFYNGPVNAISLDELDSSLQAVLEEISKGSFPSIPN